MAETKLEVIGDWVWEIWPESGAVDFVLPVISKLEWDQRLAEQRERWPTLGEKVYNSWSMNNNG